jgi:predicted transposase YbfD/YdcC
MKQQTESPEQQTEYKANELGESGFIVDVGSLYAIFEGMKGRRKARGLQYPLAAVLTLSVLAKLSGQNTPAGIADWVRLRAEWLCERVGIKLRRVKASGKLKMPCAGSYSRIMSKCMDADDLERVSSAFSKAQPSSGTAIEVCIDGKKIRGTVTADNPNGDYLLAAYLPGAGVVVMQVLIKAGEGELTVAPEMLKAIDLQGKIVTGDALFAQRNLSIQIVEAGGDYVWKVKGNQGTLESDIVRVFEPDLPAQPGCSNPKPDFRLAETITTGHGRIEKRTLTTSRLLKGYSDWPYVEQVFKYDCQITEKKTGERTTSVHYGATSLTLKEASPQGLLRIVRGHWRIENGLHYRRDVSLNEDFCGLRLPQLAHVFAILNNLALALFAKWGGGNFAAAQRQFNAQPETALALIMRN